MTSHPRAPHVGLAVLFAVLLAWGSVARAAAADDATASARSHYEMGLKLFDAREHAQALLEFKAANDLKPRPAALFMMAQCEYLLGQLKEARAHYARYASENPGGEFAELAKDRIESIDKRPATFVINTVPDDVTVRIASETAPQQAPIVGQAPNNFTAPRGRYRITVSKPQFVQQSLVVDVDIADTKPLFFKLDPIPARLEIETDPPGATLYVNGNRARNPYRQDVVPGRYELFAEAQDHESRTQELSLEPGQRLLMTGANRLILSYAQRSGRPELIFTAGAIGGLVGAAAVAAAIGEPLEDAQVSAVLLTGGGGLTGVVVGALAANALVPRYVPDNRALFIIGAMWIGAVEGAGVGVAWQQAKKDKESFSSVCPGCRPPLGERLRAAFIGSLPGLALGITSGALLSARAPTYGRVALIQSAALGGLLAGGLVSMALQWQPYGEGWERRYSGGMILDDRSILDLTLPALIGLNVGLGAGLLGAYLPDQSKYGPSWTRVLLVDLAAAAGVVGGGIAGCVAVAECLREYPNDGARAKSAIAALAGGLVGAGAGLLLTRNLDQDRRSRQPPAATATLMMLPARGLAGDTVPTFAAVGAF